MMATVGTLTPTSRVGLATGADSIYRAQAPVKTNRAGVILWRWLDMNFQQLFMDTEV